VGSLFLLYLLAIADRGIVSILLEDIKEDLKLTDVQLSLLQGLAFAAFYSILGLPAGYLIDRLPRRPILFLSAVSWSLCTVFTGVASAYPHLLLGRLGVGAAEAGIAPASYSILGDVFPRERLAAPISVWSAAGALGGALALIGGGWLLSIYSAPDFVMPIQGMAPWRLVMLTVGLPGILVAFLAFSFREPLRTATKAESSWREFGRRLSIHRSAYAGLFCGFGLATLIAYGIFSWTPTYLRREFGMSAHQAGLVFGSMIGILSVLAHLVNGFIVDAMTRRGYADAPIRFYLISLVLGLPVAVYGFLSRDVVAFLIATGCVLVVLTPITGFAAAAVQAITPPAMRAKAGALFLVVINLFGMGLGPTLIALAARRWFGGDLGPGCALVLFVAGLLAAFVLWITRRPYVEAIRVSA
jgi:MFS family permease